MKTITIPGYKNPFVVVINNTVYQYNGGETIEVPDDVAEAIEDAIELIPKPKRYLSKIAQLANGRVEELTAIDLEGISAIRAFCFYTTSGFTNVTIPSGITSIGEHAFFTCPDLESVIFVSNSKLATIGSSAFKYCFKLKSVYLPETPPTLGNADAFANIHSNCVFYCKSQASLDAYKAAANWSTLTGTYSFVVEE